MSDVHEFDNGVRVYDHHLLDTQRERYQKRNVHEEDEEDAFLAIIHGLPHNACYVNVGAAIGYYPLLARRLRSDLRIHCFEPLPRHRQFFRENIALNGFSEADFAIYETAVSTAPGRVVLRDESYGSAVAPGSPTLGRRAKDFVKRLIGKGDATPTLTVKSIGLDEIGQAIGGGDIDFLQMDIQGHEEPVLNAYFAKNRTASGAIKSIMVGTHGAAIHDACRDMFHRHGFQLRIDEPHTENQPDGILYGGVNQPANATT
ncbi:hypothetical protein Pla108_22870 [Botrimarina colliarenosi]|uniref:Methyltransferase FkbM domain-containing protein n=1 Tax=Botrimarina colliarenosi TaxID=2528001 RepID=A0A5C6AFC2_9BACT|nr:FkbM family methyltransferase [Botrimarina colliarenosi]TWT98130.1 hypothetical protein Pla108_22870 [Botrimarina colliarenosi]